MTQALNYLRCEYMKAHIFELRRMIYLLRVYYELSKWPAPSWLDSSVGRALHWYRRGHGFKSCSGLYFFFSGCNFTTALVVCITAMINHICILCPAVQIYELSYIHLYSSPSMGILQTHNEASSQLA